MGKRPSAALARAAALWTVVSRSAAPLRHKPTLILALLLAMTCLPFYFFTGITAITLVRP